MHVKLPPILLILTILPLKVFPKYNYWNIRAQLIHDDEARMIGSQILLTEAEEKVNQILMTHKLKEYDEGFDNPGVFAPGRHFFDARADIEKSEVFKLIQKMPKGGALHGHDTALVSNDFLYTLTFKENLYGCILNGRLKLLFSLNPKNDTCQWDLMSNLRDQDPNFDDFVRSQIILNKKATSINEIWENFNQVFETVTPLITHRPIFQEHFYQALEELYEDNVFYLEFRGTLPEVYELNGTTYGPLEITQLYLDVIEDFRTDHPKFIDARFIYAPLRKVEPETIADYIEDVKKLKNAFPDFVVGFDLVGQEDIGRPLSDFVEQLTQVPDDIKFYFHSAETNWHGSTTDMNLFDAIMLGTKRIGHGYGLIKHPLLMDIVKQRDIAIEVCPISNQVLMLVEDMRNHPATFLIAENYPVVISYDDPSFWGSKGLSYDFYMAYMGMASRNADLRLLKQLSRNSLTHSALIGKEKLAALDAWEKEWKNFIIELNKFSTNKASNLNFMAILSVFCIQLYYLFLS